MTDRVVSQAGPAPLDVGRPSGGSMEATGIGLARLEIKRVRLSKQCGPFGCAACEPYFCCNSLDSRTVAANAEESAVYFG